MFSLPQKRCVNSSLRYWFLVFAVTGYVIWRGQLRSGTVILRLSSMNLIQVP